MSVSIRRVIKYLFHDRAQFCDSFVRNCLKFLPDKIYLSLRFRFNMGYWMSWDKPTRFSEKMQWLKVYNRKPEYTTLVDKYAVKEYVGKLIGQEYIIPTIGVWEQVDDIEWDILPNSFVLKTTHGGGSCGVVICRDKKKFDILEAKAKLRESLHSDIYNILREWPYKNVRKRIIAEEFLIPGGLQYDLQDYKFFCFEGKPLYCQVIANRSQVMTVDFYNEKWEHQDFHEPKTTHFAKGSQDSPLQLKLMLDLATILSKNHKFLRVDFYEVNNKVYFGELTFYPTSGFGGFDPESWDEYFGSLINL